MAGRRRPDAANAALSDARAAAAARVRRSTARRCCSIATWPCRSSSRRRRDEFFYRNAEGDELVYVAEGSGVLESQMGELAYRPGDYVIIPRGILHRWRLGQRAARGCWSSKAPGPIRPPSALLQRSGAVSRTQPLLRARHPPARDAAPSTTSRASSGWSSSSTTC